MKKQGKTVVARNASELAALLDLGPSEAAEWEFRSSLIDQIVQAIAEAKKTHAEVAKAAGTSRTRVTAIVNRNVGDVSTDLLLRVLWSLGYEAKVKFRRIPA